MQFSLPFNYLKMVFVKKNITIIEVLNGSKQGVIDNIELLSKDYRAKTGRKVCKTCPSDVQYMLLTLKNIYKMANFKFRKHAAMYKDKKGDKTTISNGNLTDEKAIAFLKTNPERIKLFLEYPSNWKKLIEGEQETKEEQENRLSVEAEKKAKDDTVSNPEREILMRIPLKDLRKKYPDIKATSTRVFVDKILSL